MAELDISANVETLVNIEQKIAVVAEAISVDNDAAILAALTDQIIKANVPPPPLPVSTPIIEPFSLPKQSSDPVKEPMIKKVEMITDILQEQLLHESNKNTLVESMRNFLMAMNLVEPKLSHKLLMKLKFILGLDVNTLLKIEETLMSIIIDGKIDSNDIPKLIELIQMLYKSIYSIKNSQLNRKDISLFVCDIIVCSLKLLVEKNAINLNDKENLTSLNKLIGSLISLLFYSKEIK